MANAERHVSSPSIAKFDQEKCQIELVKMFIAMEIPFRCLEEIDDSVLKIRAAMKYIRSSPSRLTKFKACIEREIEYKGLVCLDVETRWNSTFFMLEGALKHQKTFEELEMQDRKYTEELNKGKGLPISEDWDYGSNDDRYRYSQFFRSSRSKNYELSKYLEETLESPENFDILNWWKLNSSRFPILASIAREVLAIPVSTVASESAFSTGGRVLDSYRTSLTPKMVEALICTQD
ncbi:zinc finger BED domain-containing protein RICESLEEPER 2-like [Abrus precatorius]|uniref:Zinc finger BED domain-containing protein RICESLEEPER 2-like n=1 Tax=Abrus precatorius TaxID=3816 RepID=A0A8B8MC62_ABRPR|nr:zinc finger BED domain-containing protein RICESLEEPER 2-like [Abrus precatorius]